MLAIAIHAPDHARDAVLPILMEYASCTRADAKKAWYSRKSGPIFATEERSVAEFLVGDLQKALKPFDGKIEVIEA